MWSLGYILHNIITEREFYKSCIFFSEEQLVNEIKSMRNIPQFNEKEKRDWPLFHIIINCCWIWASYYRINTNNILSFLNW